MKTIILASESARRIEMFKKHGFDPIVMPAHIDEIIPEQDENGDPITPAGVAASLAELKASHVFKNIKICEKCENIDSLELDSTAISKQSKAIQESEQNIVLFGFDTIVVFDGEIIGKPENREEAFEVLSKLSGKCHEVITGICIFDIRGGKGGRLNRRAFSDSTKVWFKSIPEEELRAYVETDEPYDKAGGYAIQGTFAKYIDHIEGDINTVIGLPWAKIEKYL